MKDESYEERWSRHPDPQKTTAPVFWDRTGWKPSDLRGKVVLDAGCGCGRFSQVVQGLAKEVIAIDASDAGIEATKKNAPKADARVEDILEIKSIPPESVDFAFSIGVLDHTGDTRKALSEVAKTVKVGGQLSIWVYPKPVPDVRLLPVLDFMHELTKAVPSEKLYDLCARYSPQIRDIYQDLGAWDYLQQIVRVSPSADDDECISDTYDWHCPMFRDWHTVDEVVEWFEENGFEVTRIGTADVNVCGTKVRSLDKKTQIQIASKVGPPRKRAGQKPRVLLVSDIPEWAHAKDMVSLQKHLFGDFKFKHVYTTDWIRNLRTLPDLRSFDVILLADSRWKVEHLLPLERTAVVFKRDDLHERDVEELSRYKAVATANRKVYSELRARGLAAQFLANPVDMARFPNATPLSGRVVAGWYGNSAYPEGSGSEDVKGYHTIITQACKRAGVQLNAAEVYGPRSEPGTAPGAYQSANVSMVASLYNSMPNAALEGMASGHVLITTDIGLHRELHRDEMKRFGDSGIIIAGRTVEAFTSALNGIKDDPARVRYMGELNRVEIASRWSWSVWRDAYKNFLEDVLR